MKLLDVLTKPVKVAVAAIGAFYLWLIIVALWLKHVKDRRESY